ncbi:MAG TPA: sigma-70 family RNA polymerase sigma factor [Gemmataceae bacterium]|nr:sigma-70 family RNA polymerase sigma factor [Gemmataceae bacterium]
MNHSQAYVILKHVGNLACQAREQMSDCELLGRFARERDEAAFTTLVRRHGPMVLHVCQRVLHNTHDAEDVCQAVFLVLASKAASGRWRNSVANWLYQTAYYLSMRANRAATRRWHHESRAHPPPCTEPAAEIAGRELQAALDEALASLPEKYRAPLVLCYLEGATRDEAAEQLGCPLGTLKSRLEHGRELMRRRLSARGLTLPATLAAALLLHPASAADLPPRLLSTVVQSSLRFTDESISGMATGTIPAAKLARAMLKSMFAHSLQIAAAWLVGAGLLAAGLGLAIHGLALTKSDEPARDSAQEAAPRRVEPLPEQLDRFGDPLPSGVVARFGTVRFRHAGARFGAVRFTPGGDGLICADDEGIVHVWDATTGQEQRRFRTLTGPLGEITLSPDQKLVAATAWEGKPAVWEIASGKLRCPIAFPAPSSRGARFAFSPDGKTIAASGAKAPEIYFFDTATGELLRRLRPEGNARSVTRLAFTAYGSTLLAKTTDGVVHFWDVATGKQAHGFRSNENISPSYALAPDGKTFAFGEDTAVILCDLATEKRLAQLQGRAASIVNGVAFSPDGKTLVATTHTSLHFWDVPSRRELHAIKDLVLRGNYQLAFAPDGKTVATTGDSTVVRLWDVVTGRELLQGEGHSGQVYETAFAPDGSLLATLGWDETLRLWEPATGKLLHTISRNRWPIYCMRFTPDGKALLTGDASGSVRFFDPAHGREIRRFSVPKGSNEENEIRTFSLSPDGRRLTAMVVQSSWTEQPGLLRPNTPKSLALTWDLDTGKEVFRHEDAAGATSVWALSSDGRLRASYNNGPVSEVHDVKSGKLRRSLKAKCEGIWPIVFSPDGRLLAGICHHGLSRTKTVAIWEVASGGEICHFATAIKGLRVALAFSPSGKLLAAGGDEEAGAQLWDLTTRKALVHHAGCGSAVNALSFSAADRRVVAGLANGTALVWNVAPAVGGSLPPTPDLSEQELGRVWIALGNADAAAGARLLERPSPTGRRGEPPADPATPYRSGS